jgi:hypothetical protein
MDRRVAFGDTARAQAESENSHHPSCAEHPRFLPIASRPLRAPIGLLVNVHILSDRALARPARFVDANFDYRLGLADPNRG